MISSRPARVLAGAAVVALAISLTPQAASSQELASRTGASMDEDAPFPIGIFSPPNPGDTTLANYQRIKDMNANFVVAGNLVETFASVDLALDLAEQTGLRMFVSDRAFDYTRSRVESLATGTSVGISTTSAPGQTFLTPASESAAILDYVELPIDAGSWTAGQNLTLSVYTHPDKSQLVASSSLAHAATTGPTRFDFDLFIASNSSFYFELSSDSAAAVTTQAGSTSAYPGGSGYLNGVVQPTILGFAVGLERRAWNDGARPSNSTIENVVDHYAGRDVVMGYHLIDEPTAQQFAKVDEATEQIRANDPGKPVYVNLNPNYANNALLGMEFSDNTGEFVSSAKTLGQVFTTGREMTQLDRVQWWIDRDTWASGESLTVTLWDSPAKSVSVGSYTISGQPSTNWPEFVLNAAVTPDTEYYMELTHNGGGNNSVGWVTRSITGTKWYGVETGAYINGAAVNADFWFTINQSIVPFSYEDYIYRWVSTEPDVVIFDHYPFPPSSGQVNGQYFSNLEVISDQSRAGAVDFWTYIQSVGITGMLRTPTENDMRYQVYTSLAYGAKGLVYFTYWKPPFAEFFEALVDEDGLPNDSYGWAASINSEVLNLGRTLEGLDVEAVYHTGTSLPAGTAGLPSGFDWQLTDGSQPAVISHLTGAGGAEYVFVVNRDNANTRAFGFVIDASVDSVLEVSKTTGLPVASGFDDVANTLDISLAPGEGRLFKITR